MRAPHYLSHSTVQMQMWCVPSQESKRLVDVNCRQIKVVITTVLRSTPVSVEQNSKDANLIQMANHFCVLSKCANILKVVKTALRPMQEKLNCPPLNSPISVEQNSKDANLIQMANHILCIFQVCQYSESGKNWFKTYARKTKWRWSPLSSAWLYFSGTVKQNSKNANSIPMANCI